MWLPHPTSCRRSTNTAKKKYITTNRQQQVGEMFFRRDYICLRSSRTSCHGQAIFFDMALTSRPTIWTLQYCFTLASILTSTNTWWTFSQEVITRWCRRYALLVDGSAFHTWWSASYVPSCIFFDRTCQQQDQYLFCQGWFHQSSLSRMILPGGCHSIGLQLEPLLQQSSRRQQNNLKL